MKTSTTMGRQPMAAMGLLLAACLCGCSGVSNFDLAFRGEEMMNPNSDKDPNQVEVRVFRLQGDAAATAFTNAEWSALWENPKSVNDLKLDGDILSRLLDPNSNPVTLRIPRVEPTVTHFGVLALFNTMPPKGSERVVLPRDTAESVEIWVHDSRIEARAPTKSAPAAATKPKGS
jgi:type VI secretion system VasD/TssJ family lipoprotein